ISTPEKKKADGTTEIASEDGKSSGDIPLEEQSEGAIKQNKVSFDNELASLNEEAKVLDSIINTKEDWQISDQELKDFQAEYASRTSDINAANTAYETKVAKFNEEFKGDNTDWPEAKINAYNEQLSALQEEEKGFAVLNQKQEEWNKGYEAYIAKHNDRSKRINEASSAHQKKIEDFNTRVKSYNERGTKEQAAPPIDEVKQKLDIANLETQKESLQKELQAAAISNDRSSMRETLSKISDIEEKIIGYETADKLKKAEDALIDTESLHTALDKIKKATGYDTAEISMENKYSQPYMWSSQYNPKRKFTNKDGVITDKTERESEKQLREKAETDKKRIEEKYRGKEGEQVEAHARIKQAEAFIEKVDKMQEAILKSEKTAGFSFSSFFDGITNVEAEDFLTLGINEMINNFDLLKVANKAGEGKELTEEEELLLSAYGSFQEAQSNPDIPISYQVGAGLTAMAPYMAQFIITGGVGTVASKGVQLAIRKTISAGVKKGIKETVKTKSYNALAKEVLARTSGYLVGAAAQTPLFPQLYTEYGRRRIGAYDKEGNLIPGTRATKTEAAMDAFAQMYSEVASERLGEAIFSPGRKLIFGKLGKEIPFVTGKGGSKVMKEVRSAAAWDGIINEYLEEFVNIYSANLLTGDKSLSEIWDNEEQLVTLLTVGIVGSSMNVANTGLNAFANYTPKKDRLNEEHITAIDGMLSLDKTVPEIAGDVLKYVSDNNLNKKQAEGALEHTLKSMAKLAAEEQLKETPPAEKKEEAVSEDVKPKEEVKLPEGLPENFTKIEIIKETKAGNVLANITDAEGDTQAISMTKAQSDAAQKVIDEKVKP
ncbi:MAG: hypothetical protein PF440_06690, partial [Thiomicrorhabdus sp.]|nr:hypothetical protein [Thiomicrorhabdus sp.]